jgi:hypothetical protein
MKEKIIPLACLTILAVVASYLFYTMNLSEVIDFKVVDKYSEIKDKSTIYFLVGENETVTAFNNLSYLFAR